MPYNTTNIHYLNVIIIDFRIIKKKISHTESVITNHSNTHAFQSSTDNLRAKVSTCFMLIRGSQSAILLYPVLNKKLHGLVCLHMCLSK